jgi:hypothetical protein
MPGMKYLHWRGIAELSFARAAASYAYFDPKRRLIRFDPYSIFQATWATADGGQDYTIAVKSGVSPVVIP